MNSTYEKRLITYKKWFHIIFISENFVVVEFCHESIIKNFTTCSKCDLKLNNWKFKRNSIKIHVRQSSNCLFVQKLNKKEISTDISVIAVEDSTSTKSVSINYNAFSSQIFYLIIENLYYKQKALLVKSEEFETMISTSNSFFIQSKFQFVASSELQTEFKFFKFNVFLIDFTLFDVDDIIEFINQVVNSSQISYRHIVIMISTYEKRLTTFKN